MKCKILGAMVATLLFASTASAQQFTISSVSAGGLGKANLCGDLGGSSVAPRIAIDHSKVAGQAMTVSISDRLSDGRTIDHGSTTVQSDASGRTSVNHAFLPPCNRTNGRVRSAYYVTVSAGGSQKQVLWGRY